MKNISKCISTYRQITPLTVFCFILFLTINATAQQVTPTVISSGGETLSSSGYTLDFVLGELATESLSANESLLTQGFLQGLPGPTNTFELATTKTEILLFPNPVDEILNIEASCEIPQVDIQILDIHGIMITSFRSENKKFSVNVSTLNAGLYFVQISIEDQHPIIKTFIKK